MQISRISTRPALTSLLGLVVSACSTDAVTPTDDDPPVSEPTWVHRTQPVMTPSGSGWDDNWVANSAVVFWKGSFRMWYGGSAAESLTGPIAIGYATSADGIHWLPASENPVLPPRPGEWDHTHVQRPAVIADGDTLRLWYGGGTHPGNHDIGYATSVDGVNWSRRDQPVLVRGSASEWNSEFVSPGTVLKEDGVFKMWFYGGRGLQADGHFGQGRIEIGFATSADGIEWDVYDDPTTTDSPYAVSDPVFSSPGGDGNVAFSPSIVRTGQGYEMWYIAYRSGVGSRIRRATSPDEIGWSAMLDAPVPGTIPWDVAGVVAQMYFPMVLQIEDRYLMWFTGWHSFPNRAAIGLAERSTP